MRPTYNLATSEDSKVNIEALMGASQGGGVQDVKRDLLPAI